MAARIHLTVEQVTFGAEETPLEKQLDSFGNVVDANVDFHDISVDHCHHHRLSHSDALHRESPLSDGMQNDASLRGTHNSKWASEPGKKARSASCSDACYPQINKAVAHFLNQHSPEVYHRAAEVLRSSLISRLSLPECTSPIPEGVFSSPLKAMGSTTEALALQQSVIGNSRVQPVSEEIVAQVVANTQKRLQSLRHASGDAAATVTELAFRAKLPLEDHHAEKNHNKMSPTRKSKPKVVDGVIFKELVPYPHNILVATTEKKSWLFGSSNQNGSIESCQSTPNLGNSPGRKHGRRESKQRRDSQSSVSSVGSLSTAGKVLLSYDLPATHQNKKARQGGDGDVPNSMERLHHSLSESVMESGDHEPDTSSDRADLESLISDVESTSGMSTIDDELFKINSFFSSPLQFRNAAGGSGTEAPSNYSSDSESKLPAACFATSCTQTVPHYKSVVEESKSTQTVADELGDGASQFDLLRKNARLEGEVEMLRSEVDKLVKERSQLQSLVASLECDVSSDRVKLDQESSERKSLQQEIEKLRHENQQWQDVINDYQHVIEAKSADIEMLKKNLQESDGMNNKLHVNIEHLKVDMDSKDGAIQGLKKKIAELHVEVQTHLQNKAELENQVKGVKAELEMMQKSRNWYQEQLQAVQDSRNKVHQELIASQAEFVGINNALEQMKAENCQLKQQLVDTQQRAVKEKEMLMKHLETIEADMIERESLFKEMQKGSAAEQSETERMKKIDEEQAKLTNLKFLLSDLELQVENLKKDVSLKETHISKLEKDHSEVMKRNATMQKMLGESEINYSKLEQECRRLDSKLKHMDIEMSAKEEQIQRMKTEQTAKDVALAAANEEKRLVHETLEALKGNLDRVEKGFKQMRTELVTKNLEFEQLQKEKDRLDESLQKAEQHLLQQKHVLEMQAASQHGKQEFKELEARNMQLEEAIASVKEELKNCQFQCSLLSVEKEKLERMVSDLQEREKVLALEAVGKVEVEEEKDGDREKEKDAAAVDEDAIQQKEAEHKFKNKLKAYESNVKVLMRKLREEMKSRKRTENELTKLRSTCLERESRCESVQTDFDFVAQQMREEERQKHEEALSEVRCQLEDALETCKELRLAIEAKEQAILELEKEKGQLSGIADSHDTLKQHIAELEAQVASKEFLLSEVGQKARHVEERHKEEVDQIQERLAIAQEQLQKEKALVKELRHQVFQEKRQNKHAKRQLENLKSGLQEANHVADARQQQISGMGAELEQKQQECSKLHAEMEDLQRKNQQLQVEVKRLTKELEEVQSRDPALAEQMNTLSWHLKQKNQEISALKQQLSLVEERHMVEVNGLQKQMQDVCNDLESVKAELSHTRKERFSYQSQVTELRGALKLSLKEIEDLRRQLMQRTKESENLSILDSLPLPESPAPLDEAYINQLLQQSSMPLESRPLSNLQACLNSLKQEMSELQRQLKDHVQDEE